MLRKTTRTGTWLSVCGAMLGICLGACLTRPSLAENPSRKTSKTAKLAKKTQSTFRLTFPVPTLLKRLAAGPAPAPQPAPSDAVVEELREIYRQNGLAMPPMTLEGLDRRQQGLATPSRVTPTEHLAPAAPPALPPMPSVKFLPGALDTPKLAPKPKPRPTLHPTPNPTHVQATLKQFRQREQINGRRHRGGLKGFCPVALKDRRELVDGRPEFNATHQGRMILFSSGTARTAFLARPEAYLPVAGGTDLVSASHRRPRMGQLDFATWYKGRLYLFATKANLAEFQQQPYRFDR